MSRSTLRVVILITGLITALVHLVLLSILIGEVAVLFILNGLGFLALLGAFYFNPTFLANRRRLVHYAFIAYTALTILLWIPGGTRSLVGYGTKIDEVILLAALWMHLRAETESAEPSSTA